jgi:hypothetical protein
MVRVGIIAVLAGCAAQTQSQVIGDGSVTLDNANVAHGAWMTASTFFDDTMPDAPQPYIGWTVVFSKDPPGTACAKVRSPSWTAQVLVYSASRGPTPEDAPVTPGTFAIADPAAPPRASVQIEAGAAERGTVTVTAFDAGHIEGTFSGTGVREVIPPSQFAVSGSFNALRCDF